MYTGNHKPNEREIIMANFTYTDGGRAEAGYKGTANDCATRALSIAEDIHYQVIYQDVNRFLKTTFFENLTARQGLPEEIVKRYYGKMGWRYIQVSEGYVTHDKLPGGKVILNLEDHVSTVIDGVIHDDHDWTKENYKVLGYWRKR